MGYQESRYQFSPKYREGNRKFFGTRQLVDFPLHSKDQYHTVTEGERIELIAWKYYQNCALWWVIAEANNILNPLRLLTGNRLRIPAYSEVMKKVMS